MLKKLLFALLIIFVLLVLAIRIGAPKFAEYKIAQYVQSADSLSYSAFKLDLWHGIIEIKGLYIADTSGNLAGTPLYINVDRIAVTGIDLLDFYRNQSITADSVLVGKGRVSFLKPEKNSDTVEVVMETPNTPVDKLKVARFQVDSVGVNMYFNRKKLEDHTSMIAHLEADSVMIFPKIRDKVKASHFALELTELYFQAKKGIQYFTAQSLIYNSDDSKLTVNDFKMRNRIDKMRYAKYFGHSKAHVDVNVFKLEVLGIPLSYELYLDSIEIPKINLLGAQAFVYKSKNYPQTKKHKKFPLEAIYSLPFLLHIDTIQVTDSQIFYQESWQPDFAPGKLDVNNVSATIYNITNHKKPKNKFATIEANLSLYKNLELYTIIKFDHNKKGQHFTMDVEIGNADVRLFNNYTEHTVRVRLLGGKIHNGKMSITANKNVGTGTLDLFYSDLKIEILGKDDDISKFKKWVGTTAVNMAIRQNNLPGQKPIQGKIEMKPELNKAIFGYMTKMFFNGFGDIALGESVNSQLKKQQVRKAKRDEKQTKKRSK